MIRRNEMVQYMKDLIVYEDDGQEKNEVSEETKNGLATVNLSGVDGEKKDSSRRDMRVNIPEPKADERVCKSCFVKDVCALYHKVRGSYTSFQNPDWSIHFTGRLLSSTGYRRFFFFYGGNQTWVFDSG